MVGEYSSQRRPATLVLQALWSHSNPRLRTVSLRCAGDRGAVAGAGGGGVCAVGGDFSVGRISCEHIKRRLQIPSLDVRS